MAGCAKIYTTSNTAMNNFTIYRDILIRNWFVECNYSQFVLSYVTFSHTSPQLLKNPNKFVSIAIAFGLVKQFPFMTIYDVRTYTHTHNVLGS